jgi:hypothetical protein
MISIPIIPYLMGKSPDLFNLDPGLDKVIV